jgi:MYXO-CTERM domain-containing protein
VIRNTAFTVPTDFTNDGSLSVTTQTGPGATASLTISGSLVNHATFTIGAPNAGVFLFGPASVKVLGVAESINSGTLSIGSQSVLSLPPAATYRQAAGGGTRLESATITAGAVAIDEGGGLAGRGTINANVTNHAILGPERVARLLGFVHGTLTINGSLEENANAHTAFFLGGTTRGADNGGYDDIAVNGPVTLSGSLDVALDSFSLFGGGTSTYVPSPTDSFVVLSANSLAGAFDNAPDGSRLSTIDGLGSFLVHYGSGAFADEVVLTHFQSAPEPSTAMAALALATPLLMRRRRP